MCRWWLPVGVLLAAGGAVPSHALAGAPSSETVPAVEPEGGEGGYGEKRIESELSIHVPPGDIEKVWQYLSSVYGKRQGWPAALDPKALTARLSDERFVDRYFDTARLDLLKHHHGVRHRVRDIPDAPEDPKDDRQLIQIKTSADGDAVVRGEYKFPPRGSVLKDGAGHRGITQLIKKTYRASFEDAVRHLGADPTKLQEVVVLNQHRRRVYFGDASGPMLTITLDEIQTKKWWARVSWAEVELELGEVRYTNAPPDERRKMEQFRSVIRADLLAHFPTLHEDNLPKYTEAVAAFDSRIPLWRAELILRANILPIATASTSVVAVGVTGLLLLRKRRRRSRAGDDATAR